MIAGLRKLRGRSYAELRERAAQQLQAFAERAALQMPRRAAGAPSIDAEHWLRSRVTFPSFSTSPPAMIAYAIAVAEPAYAERIGEAAREIASGRVQLMGYGALVVGQPPQWHRDPETGVEAPLQHWSRINFLDPRVVGNHKTLWELNRHQYLFAPVVHWLLSEERSALDLVFTHLHSWLDANPRYVGVNWASSLEVAYRAIAWCWLVWLLRDAPWPPGLLARLVQSMHWHAAHIERYLSTYFSPNTHLTGEALGLFYLGTLLGETPAAGRWRALGARVLEQQVDRHVLADGIYFEQASQYQRYTVEIYLHYAVLGASTGWAVSPAVRAALLRASSALRALASNAAVLPLLGDDDGGALLPIDLQPPHALAGLLALAARVLDRPELATLTGPAPALSCWLLGAGSARAANESSLVTPNYLDVHFRSGGVIVLRDGWRTADAVATLDAGPHGALSCGHSHADALAMTLTLGALPLFVDRGTYTYVGSQRDDYRSTHAHNTLEFDAESSVRARGPFRWSDIPQPAEAALLHAPGIVAVLARAQGHAHTQAPSLHERMLVHPIKGAWLVCDRGRRRPNSHAVLRWQLAPGITPQRTSAGAYDLASPAGDGVASLYFLGAGVDACLPRAVSPRFGAAQSAWVIQYALTHDLRAATLLLPGLRAASYPEASQSGLHWTDADGRHLLQWQGNDGFLCTPDGLRARASIAWWTDRGQCETSHGWSTDRVILVEPAELWLHGSRLATDLIRFGDAGIAVLAKRGTEFEMVPLAPTTRTGS